MSKPSWDSAPKWATYLAMDSDKNWYWYEFKPWLNTVVDIWNQSGRKELACDNISYSAADTLEKRP